MRTSVKLDCVPIKRSEHGWEVYSVVTGIITPLAICHGPIARSGPAHAHPLHAERHEESSTMDEVTRRAARTQKLRPRLDFQDHLADLEARGLLVRIDHPVNKDTELHLLVRLQFIG